MEFLVEEVVLVRRHFEDALADGGEGASGGEAGGVRGVAAAAAHEHETADADLEELVEVGRGDGEEFDAFEEWEVIAEGFVEDALVEFQPGEFAVEEGSGHGRVAAWCGARGDDGKQSGMGGISKIGGYGCEGVDFQ
jgi:hypothetical protein